MASDSEGQTRERVEEAIQKISGFISLYTISRIRPDIMSVEAALGLLSAEDFSFLYEKLAELGKSSLAEVRFNSLAEIRSAVEHDRQFNRRSAGMDEWYENEARVEARSQRAEERVLDSIVELVKSVEKNRKKHTP